MNKKKSCQTIAEEIVRERCDALGLNYIRKYTKNNKTHVVYTCPKHIDKGEISSAWTHLRTGLRGCPYCSGKYKTTEDFIKEVSGILPGVQILGEYKTARTKILTKCLECDHEWRPEARSLLYGQGCPICGKKKRSNSRMRTQEQFEDDLRMVSSNIIVVGKYNGIHKKVRCRCSIHNIEWESYPCNLLNGSAGCPMCATERFNNTPSCGEQRIAQWLQENRIEYFSECKLEGCIYKRPLRFDFYIPKIKTAIEYDGEQHFRPIGRYADDLESFKATQDRDAVKNKYCNKNGIRLLRIPYTEFSRIESILDAEIKEGIRPH